MEKQWILHDDVATQTVQHELERLLGVSPLVAKLLAQRGIDSFESARRFFRPELTFLHDPFLMCDMSRAVARLGEAADRQERVLVYGDYDADGTTAVALVYSCLRDLGFTVEYYVPDRYSEGYGISEKGVCYASELGCTLVVALDCGIKDVERIELASRRGIDFIICDHHLPGEQIPDAVAVLDPKRKECAYPYKELSGCALGFKFMQAYFMTHGIPMQVLYDRLDLVAVSIAVDVVEIRDENRVLACYGLRVLNESPSPGLMALRRVAGHADRPLTTEDVIFKLGPRINAAGRMFSGRHAVDLLVAPDLQAAMELAQNIETHNVERQTVDRSITYEALRMIADTPALHYSNSTVLFSSEWHEGVVGIVASRLVETYYRPTVVLTESNGVAKGSARSAGGYNLYEAISSCSDLLITFGGHPYAAGLSLALEDVPEFKRRFEQFVSSTITPEQQVPTVEINAVIRLDELDEKFSRILAQFEPFGPGNPVPVFAAENLFASPGARIVGQTREHLRFTVRQEGSAREIQCIAFGLAEHLPLVERGRFRMCFSLSSNSFYTPPVTQLSVKDIKPME